MDVESQLLTWKEYGRSQFNEFVWDKQGRKYVYYGIWGDGSMGLAVVPIRKYYKMKREDAKEKRCENMKSAVDVRQNKRTARLR